MSLFSSLFSWFKKEPTSDTCEDRERRYPSEQSADMCSQENDTVEVERGDIVLGVIRKIIKGGLLVDIGLEDMAFLPKEETGSHPYTWNRLLGKEHTFVVLKSEYGSVVVSLRIALEIDRQKRLDFNAGDVLDFNVGDVVEGKVLKRNKGGFIIEVCEKKVFMPYSEAGILEESERERLIGQTMEMMVKDSNVDSVIVSLRMMHKDNERKVKELMESSQSEWEGIIVRRDSRGYIVSIKGIEALWPSQCIPCTESNDLISSRWEFIFSDFSDSSNMPTVIRVIDRDLAQKSDEEIENPAENRFKLRVLDVHQNHCAFTEPFGQYVAGVLYGHNIKADGHSLPVYITDFLLEIYSTLDTPVTFEVIGSFASGGLEYAILQKDHKTFYSDEAKRYFLNLKVGDSMALKLLGATANYKILRDPKHAFWGIVSHEAFRKYSEVRGDEVLLPIASIPKAPSLPIVFGELLPTYIQINRSREAQLQERLEQLFTPSELNAMDIEDRYTIEGMLDLYPTLGVIDPNSKEVEVDKDIQIVISQNVQLDLVGHQEIGEIREMIESSNFWVAPFLRQNKISALTLFNEKGLVMVVEIDNKQFHLVSIGDANETERYLKIRKKSSYTKLKIRGRRISIQEITDTAPYKCDAEYVWQYIYRLREYVNIKNKVKESTENWVKGRSKNFDIQENILRYQKDREIERSGQEMNLSAERLTLAAGAFQGDSGALKLDINATEFESFLGGAEEGFAYTKDNAGNRKETGKLTAIPEEGYFWTVGREGVDLSEYLRSGITLCADVDVRHLDIQIKALQRFTSYDNGESLLQLLIGDNIKIPNIEKLKDTQFFNPCLQNAEDGNRQPEAVLKALALEEKGILLVQGPPGTGKTTVIVEVIRQLAKQGKKVLVCSQSHAAVDNIYKRINREDIGLLRIDDKQNPSSTYGLADYTSFIENNILLLDKLHQSGDKNDDDIRSFIKSFKYDNFVEVFTDFHLNLLNDYNSIKDVDVEKLANLLQNLSENVKGVSRDLLHEQSYQKAEVILGTCIGIGMDNILRKGRIKFDMVIIDEAGKANLAETIVPMQLGSRYLLVGDDNQLPPFVDTELISDMIQNEGGERDKKAMRKEIEEAMSVSLFEYFHYHTDPGFPDECVVTLNYQYRMHPDIGDFISDVFYKSVVRNGANTSQNTLSLEGFEEAVTVYSTENDPKHYETDANPGYFNKREAEYICEIMPKILSVLESHKELTFGIITTYVAQREYIKKMLEREDHANLMDSVYTVDSIQGNEFDIVLFSFVRSFPKEVKKKVSFLDDLRRLNVSLSRAKRKLIIVGDMDTLTRPRVHIRLSDSKSGIQPIQVFERLRKKSTILSYESSDIEKFKSKGYQVNSTFEKCTWKEITGRNNKGKPMVRSRIEVTLPDTNIRVSMPVHKTFLMECTPNTKIDIRYIGSDKDSRPQFEFSDALLRERFGFYNLKESIEYIKTKKREDNPIKGVVTKAELAEYGGFINFIKCRGLTAVAYTKKPLNCNSVYRFRVYKVKEESSKQIWITLNVDE